MMFSCQTQKNYEGDNAFFAGVQDRIRQALLVEEGVDLMLWCANAWVTNTRVSGQGGAGFG